MMTKRRRITLVMDLVGGYGRGLYAGISKYARLIGNWELWTGPCSIWTPSEVRSWEWHVDGAILFGPWTPAAVSSAKSGLPMVNLGDANADCPVPTLQVDHAAVGRLAAEHLLSHGFKHIGYVGWADGGYAARRGEGFRDAIRGRAAFYDFASCDKGTIWDARGNPVWPEPQLMQWLLAAPKPFGVFATNDERASAVVDAAHYAGLAVPEQVAMMGADNDEVVLHRLSVPLSSIELPAFRIGYEAAVLLDHLIDGETPAPRLTTEFQPIRVIPRQSTEISAVQDPEVAAAIRFMRDRATTHISMDDVAGAVSLSPRSLELRFRKAIGQSPGEFLIRARLSQAQRLLVETDLKTSVIARRSAFCSLSHFGAIFRQYVGMTPTAYRENSRIR